MSEDTPQTDVQSNAHHIPRRHTRAWTIACEKAATAIIRHIVIIVPSRVKRSQTGQPLLLLLCYRPHMPLRLSPQRSPHTNARPCGNACVPNKNWNEERTGERAWKCKRYSQMITTSGWIMQKMAEYNKMVLTTLSTILKDRIL